VRLGGRLSLPLPLGHDRETCAGADPIRAGLQQGQRGLQSLIPPEAFTLGDQPQPLHQPDIFDRRASGAETGRSLHVVGSRLHNQLTAVRFSSWFR